ncbi:MAG: PGPGW domain-containing protein [Alphaproteobacteria bacterium]
MARSLKRYIVLGLGWFFVVLGVLGIFLPVLQGILFLLIGFILLSRESEWAQRQLEKLRTRYPKFAEKYDEAEARAERLWRKLTRRP